MYPVFQTQLYKIIIARKIYPIHFMKVALHDLCLFKAVDHRINMCIFTQDHGLNHKGMLPVSCRKHIANGKMLLFDPVRTGNGIKRLIVITFRKEVDQFKYLESADIDLCKIRSLDFYLICGKTAFNHCEH